MIVLWIILGIISFLIAFFVLHVLFAVICSLFVTKGEYDHHSRFYRILLNYYTFLAIKILRIKINFKGKEKLNGLHRFVMVSNHRSCYDPIVSWYCLRKHDVAFISKPENFNVPFFGKLIKKCCYMPIDRKSPLRALETINRASDLIKRDEVSIAVYPEGTRSKKCVLLPFHNGVFKIAQRANVPIVVTTVKGTENIHKQYIRKKSVVEYEILDVLSADYVVNSSTHDIGDKVRSLMEKSLN